MREVFENQDCLYSLMLKPADGTRDVSIIGSIVEYIFAPAQPLLLLEKLADPATKIVSLTITEGGYNFDRVTGEFVSSAPAIQSELAASEPSTAFGFVVKALALRKERGIAPFTVLSCDNIQANGEVAKKMFSAFAELVDPELATWIRANVHFPNSMVDRITPVTAKSDIDEIATTTGLRDEWPVVAEPFFQWVIEDEFSLGRPPFELAGAQLVKDVMPYELMKLRLLNASHQAMAYFGFLSGYTYAHEATNDPLIRQLLNEYMEFEATPTLLPVPGVDIPEYRATLISRFSNPEVKDTLSRLCAESSDRIPKWLVPVIQKNISNGGEIRLSAAIVASWARYAEGIDESGNEINVVDPLRDDLVAIAKTQRQNSLAFIQNRTLFGDLVDNAEFASCYSEVLNSLHQFGAQTTLKNLLALVRAEK